MGNNFQKGKLFICTVVCGFECEHFRKGTLAQIASPSIRTHYIKNLNLPMCLVFFIITIMRNVEEIKREKHVCMQNCCQNKQIDGPMLLCI